MAVRIVGRHAALRTSNGGGWALFNSWIAVADRLPTDPHIAAVAQFLRGRLVPPNVHDFDLDPPPDALAPPDRLRAFATINATLAERLAGGELDRGEGLLSLDDRDLRLRWLGRLLDVHDMIQDLLDSPDQPLSLELSEPERDLVTVERWQTGVAELRRRHRDPGTVLATIEAGLPLATQVLAERGPWQLFQAHDLAAGLQAELGQWGAAAESLRAAARYADGDLAAVTLELADEYAAQG